MNARREVLENATIVIQGNRISALGTGVALFVCFSALAYWRVTGTALVARLVSMVAMAAGLVVVSTLPPAWPLAVVSASLATLVGWESVRRPG